MRIKSAEELRKIVENYEKEERFTKEKEIKELVADIVENKLIPLAKQGKRFAYLNCGKYKYGVLRELRANGYLCELYGNTELMIKW
jgi:hypothetical protein